MLKHKLSKNACA